MTTKNCLFDVPSWLGPHRCACKDAHTTGGLPKEIEGYSVVLVFVIKRAKFSLIDGSPVNLSEH